MHFAGHANAWPTKTVIPSGTPRGISGVERFSISRDPSRVRSRWRSFVPAALQSTDSIGSRSVLRVESL